jgi:DNA mismatch repair ATPase MutL
MKMEIRFKNESLVRNLIACCMAKIFGKKETIDFRNTQNYPTISPNFFPRSTPITVPNAPSNIRCKPFSSFGFERLQNRSSSDANTPRSPEKEYFLKQKISIQEQSEFAASGLQKPNGNGWNFIGLIQGGIALFEGETGIIVFNIKLAAGRITYEKLLRQNGSNVGQQLLIPIEFSLSPEEDERLQRLLSTFDGHGFSIYSFGQRSYKVDAIRECLSYEEAELAIMKVIETKDFFRKTSKISEIEEIFARHTSEVVNAGKYATKDNVEHLRDELLLCNNPMLCPSGNAIFFEIPFCDITRRFAASKM